MVVPLSTTLPPVRLNAPVPLNTSVATAPPVRPTVRVVPP